MKKLLMFGFCLMFLTSYHSYGQRRLKNLCVVYEAKDSLALKIRDFSFIFYKDLKDRNGVEFNVVKALRVDFLEDLDNSTEIYPIDRTELFEFIENAYAGLDSTRISKELIASWYERACNTNHIIEKRENFYIIYRVKMAYAQYLNTGKPKT